MSPNTLSIPLARMPNVNFLEVAAGMRQHGWLSTAYYYVVDSNYRKSVDVSNWIKSWLDSEIGKVTMDEIPEFGGLANDAKARKCLAWVRQEVRYVGDKETWGASEFWALPHEILEKGQDDCDGFATLLYVTLKKNGFSDDTIFITCGSVVGGGHAYVVYVSPKDAVHYVLDGCYWSTDSLRVKYGENPNYFFGDKEWFRFNSSGAYVRK